MATSLAHVAADAVAGRDTENETATASAAAQSKAMVESRYLMAMHRPRNMDEVRTRILSACKRPAFAATARYSKPIGKSSVVGPSIRFAEEAGRCLGNVLVETPTVYDDEKKRIVSVLVTDLESNLSYRADVTVGKTVERRQLKQNQVPLGQRVNSYGDVVFVVEATEDDTATKSAALISKALRTGMLRLLPSDILEEAMALVVKTQTDEDAKDPNAARKALVDAFFSVGVSPKQIADYLGHPIEQVTPIELTTLRTFFTAIREGAASWSDVMETKATSDGEKATSAAATSLKERIKGKAKPEPKADAQSAQDAEDDRLAAEESGDFDGRD